MPSDLFQRLARGDIPVLQALRLDADPLALVIGWARTDRQAFQLYLAHPAIRRDCSASHRTCCGIARAKISLAPMVGADGTLQQSSAARIDVYLPVYQLIDATVH